MNVYVGVSTKMYFGHQQTIDWLDRVAAELDARPGLAASGVVPFVIPSFPLIPAALDRLSSRGVSIGAQTVSWGEGALTGEVSAALLAEMGVSLVEIGHAERRRLCGETDAIVAQKVAAAQAVGLHSLLCVGELERGDPDAAVAFCFAQVEAAIREDVGALPSLMVAYEPVWAIGSDRPADPDYVVAVITGLRTELARLADDVPPIIYGGSAGPGLLRELPAADGLFLGRFAHDPVRFGRVLDEAVARQRHDQISTATPGAWQS